MSFLIPRIQKKKKVSYETEKEKNRWTKISDLKKLKKKKKK